MLKTALANVIPERTLQDAIADYESRVSYETITMRKADPGRSLEALVPYCQAVVGEEIVFCQGNFYRHSDPYLPHTDFRVDSGNDLNMVIPLSYRGEQASLVVFDQSRHLDSVTWCLDYPLIEFKVNTGVRGYPCHDKDVRGLTAEPIDESFYQRYLSHHRRECFFGLTGRAFPFEPGSVIVFDNRLIHCTSRFRGEKLGISLRFRRASRDGARAD